jgi:PhoPQ-activated pathogenicity-related protein
MNPNSPTELRDFLRQPNPAFRWEAKSQNGDLVEIKLTSQKWQGAEWKHDLVIANPPVRKGTSAILYITGDRVDRADLPFMREVAKQAKMPVVALFNIPNQPLYEAEEDALIAYTFGKYLETGDASWPLLFPMTRASLTAMDAAQQWSKGGIKSFVLFGASKRGWTTWLAGVSGDKRIKGIAPAVFDNLNFGAQLKHQLASWGKYSEMISDYTEAGLTEVLESENGKALARMTDPYSYLSDLKVPVLIMNGANDRYWTVDAHRQYLDAIKTPKWLSIVPNSGHSISDPQVASTLAFFARACVGTMPGGLPTIKRWGAQTGNPTTCGDKRAKSVVAWSAFSTSLDFRDSKWESWAQRSGEPKECEATFISVTLEADGLRGIFCSPVTVIRRTGNE